MSISILDRALGFYSISIGTSLAFEKISYTGEHDNLAAGGFGPPPIASIGNLMVNLRTLIRNAIESYPSGALGTLTTAQVIETVEDDWVGVKNIVAKESPQTSLSMYVCTYRGLDTKFPMAKFRQRDSDKQLLLVALENGTLDHFLTKRTDEVKEFDWRLDGSEETTLLTHYPLDLTSYYQFPDLKLLESHTGAIKTRKDWPSKLNKKKDVVCVPFNTTTLQIFGDSHMFSPQDLKIRNMLIKIGEKRGWNALTPYSKMREDIKLEYEPHLLEFISRYR